MTVDNLQDKLGAMNDHYREARTSEPGELPPDGTYEGIVDGFDFFESKRGDLFLKTEIKIQHNKDWQGHPVDVLHNLSDPARIGWAKRHLTTLGVECEDLATLEQHLKTVLDVPVEIAVKTSEKKNADGENYRNVFVNKRLGPPLTDVPVENPEPSVPDENGAEVPF